MLTHTVIALLTHAWLQGLKDLLLVVVPGIKGVTSNSQDRCLLPLSQPQGPSNPFLLHFSLSAQTLPRCWGVKLKVFPLALTSGGLFPTPLSLGLSSSVSLGRVLVPLNMACVFMLHWVFPAHNAFPCLTSCLVEAYLSRSCSIKCSFSVYIEQLPLLVLNFECVFFYHLINKIWSLVLSPQVLVFMNFSIAVLP